MSNIERFKRAMPEAVGQTRRHVSLARRRVAVEATVVNALTVDPEKVIGLVWTSTGEMRAVTIEEAKKIAIQIAETIRHAEEASGGRE